MRGSLVCGEASDFFAVEELSLAVLDGVRRNFTFYHIYYKLALAPREVDDTHAINRCLSGCKNGPANTISLRLWSWSARARIK